MIAALLAAMFAGSCGCGEGARGPRPIPIGTPFPSVAPAVACTVSGTVQVALKPPSPSRIRMSGTAECASMHPDGIADESIAVSGDKLAGAVVYISRGLERFAFPIPSQPAVLDQRGCVFAPHVLAVRAGQDILVRNSDPTLHNVHANPRINEGFNKGLASQGSEVTARLDAAEVAVPVTCDVHSWMRAYIAVFDHPFHSVTGADGAFALQGLPRGHYTLTVWHERLGTQSRDVDLSPATPQRVDFTLSAP